MILKLLLKERQLYDHVFYSAAHKLPFYLVTVYVFLIFKKPNKPVFHSLNRIMPSTTADGSGFKPMDGGWGWVVVVGAHISIGFAYSMPKVLSIFFKEIQEDLGTSFSEIALISSVMLAAMYGGGELTHCVLLQRSH